MRILITCFMPFNGRAKNGSQALARYLQSHLVDEDVCVPDIPVRWSIVESVALPVIEEWQPDLILGLGEGGKDAVAIETTGRNIRQGDDVDGIAPADDVIVQGGEPERKSRLTFTWSSEVTLSAPVMLSLSAGAYLCNNALYLYCGSDVERAGFVHVPPQGDDDEAAYCEHYGPVVEEILRQNTQKHRE
jgi:pyroglutamyl-peptidase